jgi:3-hydroxyacyl-CoA dehydrogenase
MVRAMSVTKPVRKVAVLGAGVMGSGIAAHCASAGIPVLLLDIVPPGQEAATDKATRNKIANSARDNLLKQKPAPLMSKAALRLIATGNLEDDLKAAAACDLVIEAVVERLDIKQKLFERLEAARQPETVIASNTSGLRIVDMLKGRSADFQKNFLVMHFFNPARYMKLLELVPGADTDPAVMARVRAFGEDMLGKGIVIAKDVPNFIANRIGTHNMMGVMQLMLEHKLAPEDIDNITGVPMGHPKSATFRTADLVGVDTMAHVVENCYRALEKDEDRNVFVLPPLVKTMLEKKLLGDKTRGGFYRKAKDGSIETLDPYKGEYRPKGGDEAIAKITKDLAKEEDVRERVKKLVNTPGVVGEFSWKALSKGLAYTARRIGEICDDVLAVDDAMKWGYNWELGPFETWDAIGFAEATDRMKKEGIALPAWVDTMRKNNVAGFYKDGSVYDIKKGSYVPIKKDPRNATLEILKKGDKPVLENGGATAWDIGDGVLALRFRTKANSIDPMVIEMMNNAVERAEKDFRALVITNDGEHFCVGANLFLVVMAAQQKNWEQIRSISRNFQNACQRLKYASVPVVAAPYGMTLGGGLEVCFGSSSVQAAAETYSGLVEVGVGLLPGGGGCMNMLWRALEGVPEGTDIDTYHFVTQVFKNIAMAKVATSAPEAQEFGYFRKSDGVSFDKSRLLAEARARALGLANAGYHPPAPRAYRLPGDSGVATLMMLVNTLVAGGFATEHDAVIAKQVARVLCGGIGGSAREVTEDEMLEIEADAFVTLCGEKKSQERMQHMLMKNKPLRN